MEMIGIPPRSFAKCKVVNDREVAPLTMSRSPNAYFACVFLIWGGIRVKSRPSLADFSNSRAKLRSCQCSNVVRGPPWYLERITHDVFPQPMAGLDWGYLDNATAL